MSGTPDTDRPGGNVDSSTAETDAANHAGSADVRQTGAGDPLVTVRLTEDEVRHALALTTLVTGLPVTTTLKEKLEQAKP